MYLFEFEGRVLLSESEQNSENIALIDWQRSGYFFDIN